MKKKDVRLAWGITGGGHYLEESVDFLLETDYEIDLFISKAAEEVLSIYKFSEDLDSSYQIYRDKSYSSPLVGRLYNGYYDLLVISPATSNTVAKLVTGISDNLVTNIFAQAGKCKIDTIILPTDAEGEVVSKAPKGEVKVIPRQIDLKNIERLKEFAGVKVASQFKEVELWLKKYFSQEN